MNNCLNCGKEVAQKEGKRERKYCDNVCKTKHWNKTHPRKKDKWEKFFENMFPKSQRKEMAGVLMETGEVIVHHSKEGIKIINPKSKQGEKILSEANISPNSEEKQKDRESVVEDKNAEIEAKIKEYEDEIALLADTGYGKQRKKFLQNKVNELKNQLK